MVTLTILYYFFPKSLAILYMYTKKIKTNNKDNNQKNKIWRKMIFNMEDGILTPCNVARSKLALIHLIKPELIRWDLIEYVQTEL